jgi:hypothetical protein
MISKEKTLAKIIKHQIGQPYVDQLYDSMRTAVYGLPGTDAIQMKDLVKELSVLLDKVEPSSAEDD